MDGGVHRTTLNLFISFLKQKQIITYNESIVQSDIQEIIVSDFDYYLENQKSLSVPTRIYYCRYVDIFLSKQLKNGQIILKDITSEDVINFFLYFSKTKSTNQSQLAASALRSFFKYLIFSGKSCVDLSKSIPSISNRRGERLTETLTQQEIKNILNSCNKEKPAGLRDYTILFLLSKFGFRSNEIINLSLDDINWEYGEITILRKGAKLSKFPMSQEVGDAIANYLKKARPSCSSRSLFLCASPPLRAIKASSTVSDIARRALKRAGLNPTKKGAYLFRHTVACSILQNGSSLSEVGIILGHQLPQTTAIYAKVDIKKLKLLTRPWPLDMSGGIK